MAAPLPEATTSTASGLAETIFSTWPVTDVSVRAKRSVSISLMPFSPSARVISLSQPSP